MTEIKITPKDKVHYGLRKVRGTLVKVVVAAMILGAVALFTKDLYDKREALVFAYTNPEQAIYAKESYLERISVAKNDWKMSLSRSFLGTEGQ